MKHYFTCKLPVRKIQIILLTGALLILHVSTTKAQLGTYTFSGNGNCPTQNPGVTVQPANATFSNFTNVNADCDAQTDVFQYKNWNQNPQIDLTQYNQFTVTANAGYALSLTSLSFMQKVNQSGSSSWTLRSSIDGYTTDIATGSATTSYQTPLIALAPANFTNIGSVSFRLYLSNASGGGTRWIIDDVTLNGSIIGTAPVVILPLAPASPTSNSPQCSNTGVTMSFSGTAPTGETWYWQTDPAGTSTANSSSTYTVNTAGTYYVRSQNNATLDWSAGAGSVTVVLMPDAIAPAFTLGANSTRCQGATTVAYTASSINSTITYSLDAASLAAGNTINTTSGAVSFDANWTGTSVITATATGCGAPQAATHTVTTTAAAGVPAFVLGSTSTRCQGTATVSYAANTSNAATLNYSLDAASISGGNSINTVTGDVTFASGWSGISTITVSTSGCGTGTATHTVTTTAAASIPVFALGTTSTRCQGAGTVSYLASSANSTGINYTLDAASLAAGNTINPSTGDVTYNAGWSGTSTITATATGCSTTVSSTHIVTVTPAAQVPVFTLGATSTRCQGAGNVTYTATAANSTGIIYSLDAATTAGGSSINAATGKVNFLGNWSGTSVITATATGCSSSTIATHTVTITPATSAPAFAPGVSTTRCQGAETISYAATAPNATTITYQMNAGSLSAGNTINSATGDVTYVAGWTGVSVIIVTATGCNGSFTSSLSVVTNATVGIPVFNLGATSTRCQGNGNVTYTANVTNGTGITYSLDAASLAGGNTINASNGKVTYSSGWSGTSIITATATGCNGPTTAVHTVTITPAVGTPVFTLGTTSTRCQGTGTVSYDATASNSTGITYSLNAACLAAGNSINSANGSVIYASNWTGSTIITATATGCNGQSTSTHTVTITPTVSTPVFSSGATSTRCQGAGTVTYTATSTNSTGMTYSLDAASLAAGNTINTATGAVTYVAGWSGAATITASAAGCNGPITATHTATTTVTVSSPVFTLGATSTRCQGAGNVTYTATAANSTGITYSLNAASTTAGNTINAATGVVTYVAGWSGTSIITATAAGCNGPATATHTVTITPTVSTPVFSSGATSTRCQGAGNVTYTATATNNTSITYSLDAASITGGNSINSATGVVIYAAAWSGTSTITASAAGCNGPKTATHVVTVTPSVSTPVFLAGNMSVRSQGVGSITYTATATNTTGITYSLDAASISAGNTINMTTGAVTYTAAWTGTTTITASAAGCNGPVTATHTVTTNASVASIPLYLSDPLQILNRVDPVATGGTTTVQTALLSSTGTTSTTFTQNPGLAAPLTIKAQTISVSVYLSVSTGTMPSSPSMTAVLKYGTTNIITLTNPVYNSSTKLLTWTGTLGADITIPAGQTLALQITTSQANVTFKIDYDSQTKPSKINLPVSTFVDITSFNVYNAAYPNGSIRTSSTGNTTMYARAVVTNPFGYADNTGLSIKVTPPGTTANATVVATSGATTTFEYPWLTPVGTGTYNLTATAKQGYENLVTNAELVIFNDCVSCPPVAMADSASGAGGAPIIIPVLDNDYDPNNDIKPSTLTISTQPDNGVAYLSAGKIVYLPNGTYAGKDTIAYQICDSTALCATGYIYLNIDPLIVDQCSDATKTHVYYVPYPEKDAYTALLASSNTTMPSNNIRTVISLTMPYPGMTIVWDEWEDGYEANALNPTQPTTKVWGDGNPYNGIAPGYDNDIIPPGGSIVLDNTMPANPRVQANIFYDGRDKITASGQIAVTQVSGEPTRMPVQDIKTNVTSTFDFGQSFTVPLGENYPDQDFKYTSLFIRAAENNTSVSIDKDANGSFDTTILLNEGQSYFVNGGIKVGATVTSTKDVGVELHAGGVDQYSVRNAPIYPATWYSNTYYTPVPTSDNSGDNPKDSSVIMFYNSLNRPISVKWNSGAPANGTINLPAKTAVRFPLAYSTSAAYKFNCPTGESFTAIELVDSYTPGGGGNDGTTYDWAFNLISESRLTDFATTAWAPGGLDLVAPPGPDVNGNPVWVTPSANTTIFVKYDGDVSGASGSLSPCGLRYDVSIPLNALSYTKIRDMSDNDQSGIAIYTCDGTKLAAVYGEDPQGSTTGIGIAYWDVGTTILPFCKEKLVFANDDYSRTLVSQPVTIPILLNDFGYLAVIDPTSVSTAGMLQPKHGSVTINSNGTVIYTPDAGYVGMDTFQYNVCSTPTPVVCDNANVYVQISSCPSPSNENVLSGQVFYDVDGNGINDDGGVGIAGAKVYLYVDGNCNSTAETNELMDSVVTNTTGAYQFIHYPEKTVSDDFDGAGGTNSCASGTDGNSSWLANWTDAGDYAASTGFCVSGQTVANTDAEIVKDPGFSYALRLKDNNVSATRTVNLSGASYAFLSFSYRRKSSTMTTGKNVIVQASKDGSTFGTVYTISGDGTTDAGYVTIYNQDITAYAAATTYIRFLTNNSMTDADTVYIDNVKIQFLKYPQCYITKLVTATIPANYHTTNTTQVAQTANSSTTCLVPNYFGVDKNTVTISGTLYNDANGLVDNLVNGTGLGLVSSIGMNAYLTDSVGKVLAKSTVNILNGTYSFSNVDILNTYAVSVSSLNLNIGVLSTITPGLASGWTTTGDAYGVNNLAGTGIKPGNPTGSTPVIVGTNNVTAVNFGIERYPNSDDKSVSYAVNTPGLQYAVPALTGSDPEDGTLGTGKTYKITSLPSNATLYYNGIAVTLNKVLSNFQPLLLKIDPNDFVINTSFTYASMDAAGIYDPTPATVTINWVTLLPITLLDFDGKLNGTKVDLTWTTSSESNSDRFEVERSTDAQEYKAFANVKAKGNSTTETKYAAVDPLPAKGVNYYRLKMVDKDASFMYSKIVTIKVNADASLETRVMPNPFTGKLDIYLTLPHACTVSFNFVDINGKVVYSKEVKGLKGFNWFVVNDLEKLPTAPYILNLVTDEQKFTQKLIKQ